MPHARRRFGNRGEREAQRFLKKQGYVILERQFTTRFGEIDLIARDGDEIVFVEVKARHSDLFGDPEASVTDTKLQKIAAVGEQYLSQKQLDLSYRVDVIAIDGEGLRHIKGVG